jgi:hypothetical protein
LNSVLLLKISSLITPSSSDLFPTISSSFSQSKTLISSRFTENISLYS